MRRRPSPFVLALAVVAGLAGSPAPAHAAPAVPTPVKMTFDAAPEPAAKGSTITMTGRVWVKETGNKGRVDLYFRTPAGQYVYRGYATTGDSGRFTRKFTAETTGTWKAVYAGTATRKNAARLDDVQVVQRRSRLIASYGPLTATSWNSPTIRIPNTDYRALMSYQCTESDLMMLTWEGADHGFDYASSRGASGTLTLNGHNGGRTGHFEVFPGWECTWSLKVYSGIVTQQV